MMIDYTIIRAESLYDAKVKALQRTGFSIVKNKSVVIEKAGKNKLGIYRIAMTQDAYNWGEEKWKKKILY